MSENGDLNFTYTGPPVKFLPQNYKLKAEHKISEIQSRQRSEKFGITDSSRPISRELTSMNELKFDKSSRRGSQPQFDIDDEKMA